MQEQDVFSCRDSLTVKQWYIGVVVRKRRVGASGPTNMQCAAVSCPPAVRAAAATALLGGPGHRLPSAPLSAACLTDRERRARSNLYCGTVAKQQRRRKKKKHLMTV